MTPTAAAAETAYEILPTANVPVLMWTRGVAVEEQARRQLANLASLPFVHGHVAAMPDVHWGLGATIGSVFATTKAIIPAAVGVDIGCGMAAALTGLTVWDLPDNLSGVRAAIEAAVPHGRTDRGGPNDRGAWGTPPVAALEAWTRTPGRERSLAEDFRALTADRHPKLAKLEKKGPAHLGTLGTGNHFLEVCLDELDRVWVMLHSGSRGIGNAIGNRFIELAKADMRRLGVDLPDQDLAYLEEGAEHFADYVAAVGWAQDYAKANRAVMLGAALGALKRALGRPFRADLLAVDCHHNYVRRETHLGREVWLTRKGAVRAGKGELGIIPGSMGARSYIVRGKGSPESFLSCSHGAGRAMSRAEAKRRFTVDDHSRATAHVECRKDAAVIDETPMAYKDIDAVMAAQADLVEVVHTLRQVVCVKG